MHGLNQVIEYQSCKFIVCKRDVAESFVKNYLEKKKNKQPILPEEIVAGVLSVGDRALDAIKYATKNNHRLDFPNLNLAGRTDLTSMSRSRVEERRSWRRSEKPQSSENRNRSLLQAQFVAQEAFMRKPNGVFVIHCEHGLHRSPAYFYAIVQDMIATKVMRDFDKAVTPLELKSTLKKARLILSAKSVMYVKLGRPDERLRDDYASYGPYPRIMRVADDLNFKVYGDIPASMPGPEREKLILARQQQILAQASYN